MEDKKTIEIFEEMRREAQVKGAITEETADEFVSNIRKERQKAMDEYLKRVNVYEKPAPLNFDLRGYTAYLEEQGLDGKNVPEEVKEKFIIKRLEESSGRKL